MNFFQNFSIIATVLQRNHTIGDFEFNNSDELKEYLKEQKPVYQMKLYIYAKNKIIALVQKPLFYLKNNFHQKLN